MSKTGTTTLQHAVFAAHSEIYYLGKFRATKHPRGCRSREVYNLLAPLIWHQGKVRDWQVQQDRYATLIDDQAGQDQVVVASWEGLGGGPADVYRTMIADLRRMNPGLAVLMCVRNPLKWLPSQYLQEIQGQYLKKNRDHSFHGRAWLSFDDWMDRKAALIGGIRKWCSYVDNCGSAIKLLGKENVGVFLFEELVNDPTRYYTAVSDYLGVDAEETIRLAADAHRNPRLTETEVDFIRGVDGSLLRRLLWRMQTPKARKQNMRRATNDQGESAGARVQLSAELKDRIAAGTRDCSLWLQDDLGLPVKEYDYPT
jgi:hypothetical protein